LLNHGSVKLNIAGARGTTLFTAKKPELSMSVSARAIEPVPHVEAVLQYFKPMAEKPHSYQFDPPPEVPRTNAVHEPRTVWIRDLRSVASQFSLDVQGAALLTHKSKVRDFYDEEEVKSVYYTEAECLVAEATGARRVFVFDHTIRRDSGARVPVPRVHNDYTVKSGPQRVRDLLPEEAARLLDQRFAVINIWRPIKGPLEDSPLAVCDAQSVAFEDFVASDLIYRDRIGETYQVKFNPAHRWFYAPRMRQEEVLLIKSYDSAEDGRARFTPHAAFVDPTAPANKLPRESIELRTLVFY
jgi:hypothetical protein